MAHQNEHDPYLVLSILDDHGILTADRAALLPFIVQCCHVIESALPRVAYQALAVADAHLLGRATAEQLTSTRVTLWQHLDTHHDRLTPRDIAGIRAVICGLYEESTIDDPYEHAAVVLDLCHAVMNQSAVYYQLLCRSYAYPGALADASRKNHRGHP